MKLYQEWRSGVGEGARLSMLQLLARADSEYKCLTQLGHLSTKHKNSDLLGLQARFETLLNSRTNNNPSRINQRENQNQRKTRSEL